METRQNSIDRPEGDLPKGLRKNIDARAHIETLIELIQLEGTECPFQLKPREHIAICGVNQNQEIECKFKSVERYYVGNCSTNKCIYKLLPEAEISKHLMSDLAKSEHANYSTRIY